MYDKSPNWWSCLMALYSLDDLECAPEHSKRTAATKFTTSLSWWWIVTLKLLPVCSKDKLKSVLHTLTHTQLFATCDTMLLPVHFSPQCSTISDTRIFGHHLHKWLVIAVACEKALWTSATTSYQHAIRLQHHLDTSLGTTASLQGSSNPNAALLLATFM